MKKNNFRLWSCNIPSSSDRGFEGVFEGVIDHGVPIPKGIDKPKKGAKSGTYYPFDKLGVGDSFFVPVYVLRSVASLVNCANVYGHRHGKHLVWEREFKGTEPGIRIWRRY